MTSIWRIFQFSRQEEFPWKIPSKSGKSHLSLFVTEVASIWRFFSSCLGSNAKKKSRQNPVRKILVKVCLFYLTIFLCSIRKEGRKSRQIPENLSKAFNDSEGTSNWRIFLPSKPGNRGNYSSACLQSMTTLQFDEFSGEENSVKSQIVCRPCQI